MSEYNVIGVMSGTSLDGVDIAFCKFKKEKNKWQYNITQAETIAYNEFWKSTLANLENSKTFDFIVVHEKYGHYLGKLISDFIQKNDISPDFIASHGHTIFHQPEKKITCQIGDGAAIAAECGIPVVCDFRSLDVAMGGQGAPLVPVGDNFLFSDYDYCLNLGGFANISFENKGKRIAFDICPVNMVLNKIALLLGKEFDANGKFSAQGKIEFELLNELNNIDYYKKKYPKSLGKEWVSECFWPIIQKYNIPESDKLCTICEHISIQISKILTGGKKKKMLVSGGGAYNSFLISRIKNNCIVSIEIPEKKIIEFKEAMIFAFLGVLRMKNQINCLSSVTGASKDNIGGAVYLG